MQKMAGYFRWARLPVKALSCLRWGNEFEPPCQSCQFRLLGGNGGELDLCLLEFELALFQAIPGFADPLSDGKGGDRKQQQACAQDDQRACRASHQCTAPG